jgi:hypothetical protein
MSCFHITVYSRPRRAGPRHFSPTLPPYTHDFCASGMVSRQRTEMTGPLHRNKWIDLKTPPKVYLLIAIIGSHLCSFAP